LGGTKAPRKKPEKPKNFQPRKGPLKKQLKKAGKQGGGRGPSVLLNSCGTKKNQKQEKRHIGWGGKTTRLGLHGNVGVERGVIHALKVTGAGGWGRSMGEG